MTPDADTELTDLIPLTHRAEEEVDPLEVVGGAWFRHSDSADCARKIAYRMADVEETDPPDLTSYHSFKVGHLVHEAWQDATDGLEIETELTIPPRSKDGERPLTGCHIDAVAYDGTLGTADAIELKSANPYTYDDAVLKGRGPKWGHIVQACMNARALQEDTPAATVRAVIVYIPLTAVSVGRAERYNIAAANRHGAKWTIDMRSGVTNPDGEDLGWFEISEYELARVRWIKDRVERVGPESVPRMWTDKMLSADAPAPIITDPSRKPFPCRDYCNFYSRCVQDGP